jgi:hypothetical protein
MTNGYAKSLPEIVNGLKVELKDFVATRLAMLRSEMQEKWSWLKLSLPALLIGAVLLMTAWLLFTALIVTAIANAFASPWAWVFAFLIVGGAYLLLGGMMVMGVVSKLRQTKLLPERTLRVLKQDEVWLQTEAKQQI